MRIYIKTQGARIIKEGRHLLVKKGNDTYQMYSAVRIAGLDPYPGVLHSLDYGRYSLVLELMEEFRTIISDTLTLSLFNLKILQQKDFIIEKPPETVKTILIPRYYKSH